jgi:hypothetical protein
MREDAVAGACSGDFAGIIAGACDEGGKLTRGTLDVLDAFETISALDRASIGITNKSANKRE